MVTDDLPAALLITPGETGHPDWVDAHRELVMVPIDFPDETIRIHIDRLAKRSTLLGAIAADGTSLKPPGRSD
jgi:hypothetical protein